MPTKLWAATPGQKASRIAAQGIILGSLPGGAIYRDAAGLFVTDGTVAGTSLLVNRWFLALAIDDDRIWLYRDAEIWVSDGTSAGTRRVALHAAPVKGLPSGLGAGVVYYTDGTTLWKTDGRTTVPAAELVAAGARPDGT